jgi:N-acylglucosamine 2-epimerase
MAAYSKAAGDKEAYEFGKKLYESIVKRVEGGTFNTLPYPLSAGYKAHGIPMILSNVTKEMADSAEIFDPEYRPVLKKKLGEFMDEILNHFADDEGMIREVITSDNREVPGQLGHHSNPGHTLEDMWFMLDGAEMLDRPELTEKIAKIALITLERGWDEKYGGMLHFCSNKGGKPETPGEEELAEPTVRLVTDGWGDKLWWIHSETLYTCFRLYRKTGNQAFLDWYHEVFTYTFTKFPNPDREINEWLQILKQDGTPQDKVVALPVKDPYHITRNMILILEEIYKAPCMN